MKKINKSKCVECVKLLLALTKISTELTDQDFEYIRANLSIAFEELKLKELELEDDNKNTTNV